jgi:hypothetical protein
MSDKFRAHRFCIISLYSADQNNDDHEDVDDNNDDDDEFKHAKHIYNNFPYPFISFNAISFRGVSNEAPSHKHSSSKCIILQWLINILARSANCVFPPPLNCQCLPLRKYR